MKKTVSKIAKCILLTLAAAVLLVLLLHGIGSAWNRREPEGGINESMYVRINGAKQWINIYGQDRNNPVLLYLHGGPGSATSDIDYAFTRKWSDVYTVVTWDQRNCGKSYDPAQNDIPITRSFLMEDGKELTEWLLSFLGKDKITLLGHSWGSIYGANLALAYPEYYDCFIGAGQLVDSDDNEAAFKEKAAEWAAGDAEAMALVDKLTPGNMTLEHIQAKNELMAKYGYDMMKDGTDYPLLPTVLFNPNYSLADWVRYFSRDLSVYIDFFSSDEFRSFSLKGRCDYQVPYYNINGDMDYQTNFEIAQAYFEQVNAPAKQLFLMKNTTHGLLESKSEEFSAIVHQIHALQFGE